MYADISTQRQRHVKPYTDNTAHRHLCSNCARKLLHILFTYDLICHVMHRFSTRRASLLCSGIQVSVHQALQVNGKSIFLSYGVCTFNARVGVFLSVCFFVLAWMMWCRFFRDVLPVVPTRSWQPCYKHCRVPQTILNACNLSQKLHRAGFAASIMRFTRKKCCGFIDLHCSASCMQC